jgi:hypothetical protein
MFGANPFAVADAAAQARAAWARTLAAAGFVPSERPWPEPPAPTAPPPDPRRFV